MSDKDGGAAFPQTPPHIGTGMVLRDYFAAQAIHIVLWKGGWSTGEGIFPYAEEAARLVYAIADAMLKERAK